MSHFAGVLRGIVEIAYQRDLNRFEIWAFILLFPIAAAAARFNPGFVRRVRQRWNPPSGMRAALTIAALAIAARALLLIVDPIPTPHVTDEFSFLLQADTFWHGRLSNPTPTDWHNFESIHVFFTPTYASMYFPMQGLILALGEFFGSAWIGVLLSSGVMCGAIVWMLEGWMPSRWAFFGGLLAVARFALFSYWIDGYYGGFHSAIGGALVLGAWPRLNRKISVAHAAAMGVGLAILAWGRPYEGLLLCAPVAVGMFFFSRRPALRPQVFVPIAAIVVIAALALGFYCSSVTGSFWKAPYQVNRQQYGWPQTILFTAAPQPPPFRNPEMQHYFEWESSFHAQADSSAVFFVMLLKYTTLWAFYVGPALTPALLFALFAWRDRRIRPLIAPAAVLLAGLALSQTVVPHYAAPATAAIVALLVQGFRHMRFARLSIGPALVAAVVLTMFATIAVRAAGGPGANGDNSSWCCVPPARHPTRDDIARDLKKLGGNHIVFVRYTPAHFVHDEWVYNDADIASARVVWSRVLTKEENRTMVAHYPGRRVWQFEPDAQPPVLREIINPNPAPAQP